MRKKLLNIKHLEVGRFYLHNDKYGGHPAYLYKKRDSRNEYYILIFTSSDGPKRTKLSKSLEPSKVANSYVHNVPSIVKRRDLGSKPLVGLKIDRSDKVLLKLISRKK